MTTDAIKEIVEDLKQTAKLVSCEKADVLKALRTLYSEECEPLESEIGKLIDFWD